MSLRPHFKSKDLSRSTDSPRNQLTPRELEVIYWVSEGKRDREIAVILGRSPRTIEKHVCHILAKLRVETRTAAVNECYHSLLLPRPPQEDRGKILTHNPETDRRQELMVPHKHR